MRLILNETLGISSERRLTATKLDRTPRNIDLNGIQLRQVGTETVEVYIPLTQAEHYYYRFDTDDVLTISNDLRLVRLSTDTFDPKGLFALLQFGTILPHSSPWRQIRRIPAGVTARISAGETEMLEAEDSLLKSEDGTSSDSSSDVNGLTETIDQVLIRLCPEENPLVLFSGGVDSALIAARCSALGWKDTTLINYSFGPEDTEAQLASQVADRLGLKLETLVQRPGTWGETLDSAAEHYPFPFGDLSTPLMLDLVQQMCETRSSPRVVLDGTGADGAFGLSKAEARWRLLERVPKLLRRGGASLYQNRQLWLTGGFAERTCRLLRRSSMLPVTLAAVAQNPLQEILYSFTSHTVHEALNEVSTWLERASASVPMQFRIPLADLTVICSGIFAQKNYAVLSSAGFRPAYPFLRQEIMKHACFEACRRTNKSGAKLILKQALARQIPKELVYRPKSAFAPPQAQILRSKFFRDAFDKVVDSKSPLGEWLDRRALLKLQSAIARGSNLPHQTASFAWLITFVNEWLVQLNEQCASRTKVPVERTEAGPA